MLDLSSTQHRTSGFSISQLEKNSVSQDSNMSDFLNAFEAFLSGGSCPEATETDRDSESAEATEAEDCAIPAGSVSLTDDVSPSLGKKIPSERTTVKMPPDKEPTSPPPSSPPSVSGSGSFQRPPSPPSQVPSAGPLSSSDRTAVSEEKMIMDEASSSSGGAVSPPPLVPRTSLPQIKPIVPPIKLRKVD